MEGTLPEIALARAAGLCQNRCVDPALLQRLVTFNTYFYGFLLLDRLSYFGDPPSGTESWLMALILGSVVTFVSPFGARWLEQRSSRESSRPPRPPRVRTTKADRPPKANRPRRDRPGQRSSNLGKPEPAASGPVAIDYDLDADLDAFKPH